MPNFSKFPDNFPATREFWMLRQVRSRLRPPPRTPPRNQSLWRRGGNAESSRIFGPHNWEGIGLFPSCGLLAAFLAVCLWPPQSRSWLRLSVGRCHARFPPSLIGSIDPIRELVLTPRSLSALDCSALQSEQTVMLTTFLIIIVCIAAGTVVHRLRCERRFR